MDRKTDEGFVLISVMIALVIIGLMLWVAMKPYLKPAPADSMMKDAGVNTSSYKSVIDSARQVTQDAANAKPTEYPGLR